MALSMDWWFLELEIRDGLQCVTVTRHTEQGPFKIDQINLAKSCWSPQSHGLIKTIDCTFFWGHLQLHCSVTIPANLIWIYASFDSNSNCCNFEPSHQMPSFENQKQIMHASIFTPVRDQILNVEKVFLFVQSNIYILFLRLRNKTIS